MSDAEGASLERVAQLMATDATILARVSAALWALCGRRLTLVDLDWARRLWGPSGPQLLWDALAEAGALVGQPLAIASEPLAALIASWAGVPGQSPVHPVPLPQSAVVATLPNAHPLAAHYGDSLRLAARAVVEQATATLVLCAPYLDRTGIGYLLDALRAAALRGVAITLITHDLHDPQSANAQAVALLRRELAGAVAPLRYYTVPPAEEPHHHATHIHAKLLLADDRVALIGSANLTGAGLGQNVEVGVLLEGTPVAALVPLLDALLQSGLVVVTA